MAGGDTFDVARVEACTLELARRCGLTVPQVRHVEIGGRCVMLIRRFERYWAPPRAPQALDGALYDTRPGPGLTEGRLPFVSGLTLVGCSELESRTRRYADLAAAIRARVHPSCIRADVQELFARMVFNIFVNNDDDHLRIHGFVRDPLLGGWRLAAGG